MATPTDKKAVAEVPTKDERNAQFKAFAQKINKAAGGSVIIPAADIKKAASTFARWSTGIFSLDYAMAGGVPAGRVIELWGEKSAGKTLVAMRVAASVQRGCATCVLPLAECGCGEKQRRGKVLWVDTENVWDQHQLEWIAAHGVNLEELWLARPEHAAQGVDVITEAYQTKGFDLIVVDSLAHFTPLKEIEEGAEEWQMGLGARILNKGFRIWMAHATGLTNAGLRPPTLMVINQVRMKQTMYGDPRTQPGGKGQEFAASVFVEMKRKGTVDDPELNRPVVAQHVINILKNRTGTLVRDVEFQLVMADLPRRKKGAIIEEANVLKWGRAVGLIEGATKPKVDGKEFPSPDALEDYWVQNPAEYEAFKKRLMPLLLVA